MQESKTDYTSDCQVIIAREADPSVRSYPLAQNWLCHARRGPYFVFVIPVADDGIYAGSELPYGLEVIAELKKTTAMFFLWHWLSQTLKFVIPSPSVFPTEGYAILRNFSDLPGFYSPAHAIRIKLKALDSVEREALDSIDAGFLDYNCVRDWQCTHFITSLWCEGLRSGILKLEQQEDQYSRQLGRTSDPSNPFEVHLSLTANGLSKELKHCVCAHLYPYWEHTNTKGVERARQMKWIGFKHSENAGTISNFQATTGLQALNDRQAREFFTSLEGHATRYWGQNPHLLTEAETEDFTLLQIRALQFLFPIFPNLTKSEPAFVPDRDAAV